MADIILKEKLNLLPDLSGVYLMKDKLDEIIYIGKAKNLKKRVKSYFNRNHDSAKLRVMVPKIVNFEFIITDTEIEALILESHLIKKHKPKYNVLLKDDKKFPWFVVTDEDYPRILITRKVDKKLIKGKYFGPYTDSRAMYSTLELIKKLFPLKQCKTPRFKDRPCIYYQMGKCLGPCQKLVSSDAYKQVSKQVELFLSGKQTLVEELQKHMNIAAEKQEYEKAAKYRDSFLDVMKVVERQKVVSENTTLSQDIIGFDGDMLRMSIVLLKVRDGRLIAKEDFDINLDEIHSPTEALSSFIKEYYQMLEVSDIPKEILIQEEIDDKDVISEWLTYKKSSKVNITIPKTDKKYELIEMAKKNAVSSLENLKLKDLIKLQNDWNEVGSYIQDKLDLPDFPHRIECFDISHIQGTNTVASMVVFINGKSTKSEYRRFKIRSLDEGSPDDFASMKEVMLRRYTKLIKNNEPLPELVIIDGGKGQLSASKAIFDELGLFSLPVVSLAKRLEEVFLPDRSEPVILPLNSPAMFLFQRIRDEAHRFAVSYHRKLREKQALKSALDSVPNLGLERKKQLIEHFGDVKKVLAASESEIARVIGKFQAKKFIKYIKESNLK